MPLLVKVRSLLRNLLVSRREEVDLDHEVRAHLEMLTEECFRSGMSLQKAQRAARIELGGIEQVKERVQAYSRPRYRGDHGNFQCCIRRIVATVAVPQREPDRGHL